MGGRTWADGEQLSSDRYCRGLFIFRVCLGLSAPFYFPASSSLPPWTPHVPHPRTFICPSQPLPAFLPFFCLRITMAQKGFRFKNFGQGWIHAGGNLCLISGWWKRCVVLLEPRLSSSWLVMWRRVKLVLCFTSKAWSFLTLCRTLIHYQKSFFFAIFFPLRHQKYLHSSWKDKMSINFVQHLNRTH